MFFTDSSSGIPCAKDPAVVKYKKKYFMYYSIPPYEKGDINNGWSIGIASSTDMEYWEIIGNITPSEKYEQNGICAPGVILLNNEIHLFYQTYGNGRNDAICHAVSKDGVSFIRNETNPIFSPVGDWNCGRAIDADVIVIGKQLMLYFATRDPKMEFQMLGLAASPVNSGFTKESWKQICDGPILKPELYWEENCIEAPAVCMHNDMYYMFYAGAYNNAPQQIGCAVSKDGISWSRISQEPVLSNGKSGEWNSSESGHPYVFTDDTETWLFFQGNNDMGKSWYISRLEITWEEELPKVNR